MYIMYVKLRTSLAYTTSDSFDGGMNTDTEMTLKGHSRSPAMSPFDSVLVPPEAYPALFVEI